MHAPGRPPGTLEVVVVSPGGQAAAAGGGGGEERQHGMVQGRRGGGDGRGEVGALARGGTAGEEEELDMSLMSTLLSNAQAICNFGVISVHFGRCAGMNFRCFQYGSLG